MGPCVPADETARASPDRIVFAGLDFAGFHAENRDQLFGRSCLAPVAQLDRVSVFETEGCPFKPGRARQKLLDFPTLNGTKAGSVVEYMAREKPLESRKV